MTPKTVYSCTFVFWREHVLLVRKNHPEWQAGRYNGIGGRLEPLEPPRMGAARELEEETGLVVPPQDLVPMILLNDGVCIVHFFRVTLDPEIDLPSVLPGTNDAGEPLYLCFSKTTGTERLPWQNEEESIENLSWLVPMALDRFHVDGVVTAHRRMLVGDKWEPVPE